MEHNLRREHFRLIIEAVKADKIAEYNEQKADIKKSFSDLGLDMDDFSDDTINNLLGAYDNILASIDEGKYDNYDISRFERTFTR